MERKIQFLSSPFCLTQNLIDKIPLIFLGFLKVNILIEGEFLVGPFMIDQGLDSFGLIILSNHIPLDRSGLYFHMLIILLLLHAQPFAHFLNGLRIKYLSIIPIFILIFLLQCITIRNKYLDNTNYNHYHIYYCTFNASEEEVVWGLLQGGYPG